jgi:hypothetical protein
MAAGAVVVDVAVGVITGHAKSGGDQQTEKGSRHVKLLEKPGRFNDRRSNVRPRLGLGAIARPRLQAHSLA